MTHVTSREFRTNQASIFDRADAGEQIIITRRGKQSYMLLAIHPEDYAVSPDLEKKIMEARAEYAAGETVHVSNEEELKELLSSL